MPDASISQSSQSVQPQAAVQPAQPAALPPLTIAQPVADNATKSAQPVAAKSAPAAARSEKGPSREQQFRRLVNEARSVLVCLPHQPSTDAIASGLALQAALTQLGKTCQIVSQDFRLPFHHEFLQADTLIAKDLAADNDFLITVSLKNAKVEELSYTTSDDALQIRLAPKSGTLTPADVTTTSNQATVDLVIVLDSRKLEQLGEVYTKHAQLFYNTPIVNIDHHTNNEYFGQLDLVRLKAVSVTEIVAHLIVGWKEVTLDEKISTALLSGMIAKTKSFQSSSVTPQALALASRLVELGARRDEIIKHLYQSKKLSTLKLWGRVLSGLQSDPDHQIVWATVTQGDFSATGANVNDVDDVIDELLMNTPDIAQACIFSVLRDGSLKVLVHTGPHTNALELFADLLPRGTEHQVRFVIRGQELEAARKIVLERLKK